MDFADVWHKYKDITDTPITEFRSAYYAKRYGDSERYDAIIDSLHSHK